MKNMCFKSASFLFGLAALTVLGSPTSASAETPSTTAELGQSETAIAPVPDLGSTAIPTATVDQLPIDSTIAPRYSEPSAVTVSEPESIAMPAAMSAPVAIEPAQSQTPQLPIVQPPVRQTDAGNSNPYQAGSQILPPDAMGNYQQAPSAAADNNLNLVESILGTTNGVSATQPIPGTLETSAASLTAMPVSPSPEAPSNAADTTVAQTEIDPGRPTRGGQSYIGIGGSIGLSGDSAIGDGGFAINAKVGLTPTISVRPGVIIGDSTDFLLPVTYDFVIQTDDPFEPVPFAPFVGGGVAFSTGGDEGDIDDDADVDDDDGDGDGDSFGFLLTAGADFPISPQFVANAAVNVGFYDGSTDFGILLGVGYTFPNLFR